MEPSYGITYLANKPISETSTIKNCLGSDCNSNCGEDIYSHCNSSIGQFCAEDNINYLSGSAILNKTKCSGNKDNCVNKYWKNIETIKDIYDEKTDTN